MKTKINFKNFVLYAYMNFILGAPEKNTCSGLVTWTARAIEKTINAEWFLLEEMWWP